MKFIGFIGFLVLQCFLIGSVICSNPGFEQCYKDVQESYYSSSKNKDRFLNAARQFCRDYSLCNGAVKYLHNRCNNDPHNYGCGSNAVYVLNRDKCSVCLTAVAAHRHMEKEIVIADKWLQDVGNSYHDYYFNGSHTITGKGRTYKVENYKDALKYCKELI
eukprot:jgi/Orpsp1_1/1190847/evm.model.d7180000081628.1